MKKLMVAALASTMLFAACSHDKADYKNVAEKALRDELKKENITGTVACDNPASTNTGTEFKCTITFAGGTTQTATAKITSSNQVTVTPDAGGATDSGTVTSDAPPTSS